MKRIGKVLHLLFSRLPFVRVGREEVCKTGFSLKSKAAASAKHPAAASAKHLATADSKRPAATDPKCPAAVSPKRPTAEDPKPPTAEDRLLALRLRRTIESRRLFLRPGLTLADVAAEMNIEPEAVERIFAHFIGENVHRYLDELRIAYAAVLFMGKESHLYSLERIGAECGFADTAAFAHACCTLTGMTPGVMREFTRGRKSLRGLFLAPPAYLAPLRTDTPEEENLINNI